MPTEFPKPCWKMRLVADGPIPGHFSRKSHYSRSALDRCAGQITNQDPALEPEMNSLSKYTVVCEIRLASPAGQRDS